MPDTLLWLLAGVICLAAEALGISGIGLLFVGLGALTTGSFVTFGTDITDIEQWVIFFGSTALWAIALWKPMQRFRIARTHVGYSNMVGDTAYIGAAGLQPGMVGEATWSGTIMRAELAEGVESIAPGAQALIVAVAGNTLVVKPK